MDFLDPVHIITCGFSSINGREVSQCHRPLGWALLFPLPRSPELPLSFTLRSLGRSLICPPGSAGGQAGSPALQMQSPCPLPAHSRHTVYAPAEVYQEATGDSCSADIPCCRECSLPYLPVITTAPAKVFEAAMVIRKVHEIPLPLRVPFPPCQT